MSRRSGLMSEELKVEIAKELGVYEQVKQDGGPNAVYNGYYGYNNGCFGTFNNNCCG
jgi:hypothetical protein